MIVATKQLKANCEKLSSWGSVRRSGGCSKIKQKVILHDLWSAHFNTDPNVVHLSIMVFVDVDPAAFRTTFSCSNEKYSHQPKQNIWPTFLYSVAWVHWGFRADLLRSHHSISKTPPYILHCEHLHFGLVCLQKSCGLFRRSILRRSFSWQFFYKNTISNWSCHEL